MSTDIKEEAGEIAALKESLAAFRRSQVHKMVLPESGLEVELKKVNLMDLVMRGDEIPDSLSGLFEQSMNGDAADVSISDIGGMAKMFNMVVLASVSCPPVVDGDGDEEHLGTNEISFMDKQEIFNYGNGEAHSLIPFRNESRELDLDALAWEDL